MSSALNKGFSLNDCAAVLTALRSAGVYALKACWILFPNCVDISSGISFGLWEIKYKPIPRDLINFTTWVICFN